MVQTSLNLHLVRGSEGSNSGHGPLILRRYVLLWKLNILKFTGKGKHCLFASDFSEACGARQSALSQRGGLWKRNPSHSVPYPAVGHRHLLEALEHKLHG